jgi:quinol monooxygenase YgiN
VNSIVLSSTEAKRFLYERYESQEHLNRHRENPVLRRFVADASTLVDGKLDIRTFRVIAAGS